MSSPKAGPLRRMLTTAISSLVIFILMYLLTTHASEESFQAFMKGHFGYSDRYSSFGPDWFIYITWDLGALAGQLIFLLIVSFVTCLLFVQRERKILVEFLLTIAGAVILLLFLRFIFRDNTGFPSGHAIISIVLYSSLAKYSARKLTSAAARKVVYAFNVIVIVLIGLARLFTSHYPTEVVAGWCAGLFWLSIVNYFFSSILPSRIQDSI